MSHAERMPQVYLSMPHPCGYIEGRMAVTLFVDPSHPVDRRLFTALTRRGFRRSGELLYRPHCGECTACVSVRVPVGRFRPNRSQRRTWRRNRDLEIHDCEPIFNAEHFDLYLRYQRARHPDSHMNDPDPEKYVGFLTSRCLETRFFEFRAPGHGRSRLVCVAVVDRLDDGLSAVYTFYDPQARDRGLGVYAILWEIARARQLGLTWLYLGYWIEGHPKMDYKINFQPLEAYRAGRWSPARP